MPPASPALPIALVLLALLGTLVLARLQRRATRPTPTIELAEGLDVESALPRADVLGAVRHELRLPLGADRAARGELYLVKASDSSVVVAANDRRRPVFVAVLRSVDTTSGSRNEYRVQQPAEGADYQDVVRDRIVRAVRSVDPTARIERRAA